MPHKQTTKTFSLSVLFALFLAIALCACTSQDGTDSAELRMDESTEILTESEETAEASDTEDLSGSWFGDYTGELGEVSIFEAQNENALNISFYLNDSLGSMYSNSAMELKPDGSAADEYLALCLDGGTLTVEALRTEFQKYAGIYEKPKTAEQSADNKIDNETALTLINNELSDRGWDTEALGLTLYYNEPTSVLTPSSVAGEAELRYVDAWIFLGEDSLFYAATVNGGEVYQYDMASGALMDMDE